VDVFGMRAGGPRSQGTEYADGAPTVADYGAS
jgi:hypothetical protein